MFCKTCGSLLVLQKTPYGKWLHCPNNHSQPKLQEFNQQEHLLNTKNNQPAKRIAVSDGKNILAVHQHVCKKCGYGLAELIEISCSYTDEDNIYQYKCGKCGAVEQQEGKVK